MVSVQSVALLLLIFVTFSIQAKKSRPRHQRDFHVTTLNPFIYDEDEQDTEESILTKTNPCLVHYCGQGKRCIVKSDGSAECSCVRDCPPHGKRVCGSDGIIYQSHCHLHRAACLQNSTILTDHSFNCSKLPPDDGRKRQPQDTDLDEVNIGMIKTDDDEEENLINDNDCSQQEYEVMKDNLLLYNHAKLLAEDNKSSGKEYLVSIMFSRFDLNNNGALEKEELHQVAEKENLYQLSASCNLASMIPNEDSDKDGKLTINEFYVAFSKLYSVSVISLDKSREVSAITARVGDSVEIKCDVTGTPPPPISWQRNGADLATLNDDDVHIFSDGTLYLTRIQLLHAGNYTCHAARNPDVMQTHILTVHTVPEVSVTPRIQSKRPGDECSMFCHVVGEPFPQVQWLKNDESLRLDIPGKYDIVGNGTELQIRDISYADTGAYMCQASNIGGITRDISSLVVQEEPSPAANEERRFFAFHDWGIGVYEPTACRLYHVIAASDIIPGTQERVCAAATNCSWGHAINVANRYVYVAQPRKDRILVISKIQMVVVDVVVTDKTPVELHYVPHLDQVWVLNWRSDRDLGMKTIQVIRDASQKRKHHTVHPEPIDGQFDLVRGLYIPTIQDMSHQFKYGYVSHGNQRGLYKLDLANMRYTRSVDLSAANCVPRNVQFSALYGFVIVECEEMGTGRSSGQLVLDYMTDTILSNRPGLFGAPHVSPNSRLVVTLDRQRDGVTLVVQRVTNGGLRFLFDVKTTLNISAITFYPSQTTHGYDLYASASDKEDILFLNLVTGKVEMITGVGRAMAPSLAEWGAPNRPIVASGVFGHFMVTPCDEALFVINGETRTVNCEIGGLTHPRVITWVTMQLQ